MFRLIIGEHGQVDINGGRSLFSIIYLAVVGPCVFVVQPGYVQGLVEYLSLSETQAGNIAAAEMWGIAVTTILLIALAGRYSWRRMILLSVLVCGFGNLASIGQADVQTLSALRFLTGLGSGGIISLTFTMASLTERADRNFGLIVVWVLTYGSIGMFVMPSALAIAGVSGVLAFFGLFCLSGLYFLRFLPDAGGDHEDSEGHYEYPRWLPRLSLLGILSYNLGVGIVWVYLFLVGIETGMEEQAVANALTISQILGIVGALTAVVLEARFGRVSPLSIGIIGGALSTFLLIQIPTPTGFWLGVCGFNLLWNLSMPYLLATAGDFDAKGKTVVYAVAMQMLGLAFGPMVAAQLLATGGYDAVNGFAVFVFFLSAILITPAILAQRNSPVVTP